MKVCIAVLVMLCSLSTAMRSQDSAPSVISPNGGIAADSHMILEWTIGEVAVQTLRSGDNVYTEGFHQPVLKVEIIEQEVIRPRVASEDPGDKGTIRVVPNPVSALLTVYFDFTETMEVNVQVNDVNGRMHKNEKVTIEKGSLDRIY